MTSYWRAPRLISIKSAPLIEHHIIDGNAVLPTACAMAWMSMAARSDDGQSLNDTSPFILYDYKLFNGVVLGGTQMPPRTLQTECQPLADNTSQIKIYSQVQDKLIMHYQARVQFAVDVARRVYQPVNLQDQQISLDQSQLYDTMMFHTGCLRGIEKIVNNNAQGFSVACRVNSVCASMLGDFANLLSNPLVDDLVLQALILWPRFNVAKSALPSKFASWTYIKTVPMDEVFYISLSVCKLTSMQITADIVVHDQQGGIYQEVVGAVAIMSEKLNQQFLNNKLIH